MFPRISLEMKPDPFGSPEYTLETADIGDSSHINDTIGNVGIT
jgi:hypothetical protein